MHHAKRVLMDKWLDGELMALPTTGPYNALCQLLVVEAQKLQLLYHYLKYVIMIGPTCVM